MPTHFAFRLSMYLTLGIACLCLGYAEADFLPEASVFAGLVLGMLVVSFLLDGRYELDLRAANQLGFVIGIVAVLWMTYQFVRADSLIYTFPWPASLLPYLGPLLMILMPAKLFRPKHTGDWWTLQGLGLAAVGLATAMCEDAIFGVLLVSYGLVVVWSLTIFYFRRSAGLLPAIDPTVPQQMPIVVSPAQYVGRVLLSQSVLWQSLGRLTIALILSLPLFFLVPRSNAPRWQFNNTIETGLGDTQVDLNRTGQLRINREVAFTVTASYPDGRPKLDLPPISRWRSHSHQSYIKGKWGFTPLDGSVRFSLDRRQMVLRGLDVGTTFPPDLHPEQYILDLELSRQQKNMYRVVKDPVRWQPNKSAPIASRDSEGWHVWSQTLDGHFTIPTNYRPRRYRQVTYDGVDEPDLSAPLELSPEVLAVSFSTQNDSPLNVFRRVDGLPRVRDYARDLLTELAKSDPALQSAIKRADNRQAFQLNPLDYEIVARAFTMHLSGSPEFTYSLTLKRTDMALDPVEDFLFKTKSGHCERYATALALLCRSVGIPAVYTIGYRGCEEASRPGDYVIRQDDAHAWVEVFIPRLRRNAEPIPFQPDKYVWHWLTLDPTPSQGEEPQGGTFSNWFGTAKESSVGFFLDFIVGYNPERRQRTVNAVKAFFDEWWWVFPFGPLIGLLIWTTRRAWLNRPKSVVAVRMDLPTGIAWLDKFRDVLKQHHLELPDGQTWKEYEPKLALQLADSSAAKDALKQLISAIYQTRYAGEAQTQEAELAQQCDVVETALKAKAAQEKAV
jgi:protein-glutamine gamma-glutamyltransferase